MRKHPRKLAQLARERVQFGRQRRGIGARRDLGASEVHELGHFPAKQPLVVCDLRGDTSRVDLAGAFDMQQEQILYRKPKQIGAVGASRPQDIEQCDLAYILNEKCALRRVEPIQRGNKSAERGQKSMQGNPWRLGHRFAHQAQHANVAGQVVRPEINQDRARG